MKFYPCEKGWEGGAEKVSAMLKGGTKSVGGVFTWYLQVLAILKRLGGGGAKTFHSLKRRGREQFYPVLRGGGGGGIGGGGGGGHNNFRTREIETLFIANPECFTLTRHTNAYAPSLLQPSSEKSWVSDSPSFRA